MGDKTGIEWTDATWNPVTGCDHVSPGCLHCYAETMAKRLAGRAGYPEDEPFRLTLQPSRLDQPLRWTRPRRIFVNSMSDLFHQQVPADYIGRVFNVMAMAKRHLFQVLTKRPQRMRSLLGGMTNDANGVPVPVDVGWEVRPWPLPNVWLGTSIESDRYAFRADHLRATPAAVRFLSLEPLLGPLPSLDLTGLDWVIVGGESGAGARPMHVGWVRDLRDRCVEAGVPFLFKQWGAWGWPGQPGDHALTIDGRLFEPGARLGMDHMMRPTFVRKVGKRAAGRELDGRTWDEYPEVA